jgi:drug/metabolite transporter (DMT)-like permease
MATAARRATIEGAAAMSILGASTGVSAQLTHYPILGGQALRYLLAAILLSALAWRQGRGKPTLWPTFREWLLLGALSLDGLVLFNLLVMAALRHTDPATLGSTIACAPLLMALAGPMVQRSGGGISSRLIGSAMLVVIGSVLVQGFGAHGLAGSLFSISVLICEVLFSLLAVPLLPRLGPVRVSAATTALAVPMFAVAGVATSGTAMLRMPTTTEATALLYLALLLTVGAFVLWYRCLGSLGPQRAGLLIGVVPLSASAAGVVLGSGIPTVPRLAGVGLVTVGIAYGMSKSAASTSSDGVRSGSSDSLVESEAVMSDR